MVSRWGHFFSRVRHPGVLDREKVPERCNGLHARRMAVLSILRALSGRPVHRELLRSVVLDLTPIISTTACHQRNYGWVATRRGLHKPVSSSPPLKTVRTTFMVYGFAPAVPLRDPRSVPSHFASSSGVHPWTACAFAGYLWSGLSAG